MKYLICAAVFACLTCCSALVFASSISVHWTTVISGDLNGTAVTFDGSDAHISNSDLSGSDFSAAPLSASTEIISYDVRSDWTATFSSSVSNCLLYAVSWRGTSGGASPVNYMFDQPFTILSGLGSGSGRFVTDRYNRVPPNALATNA